uniref:Uncharacterized protein n=1 Tax=Ixodes ricinus TaxID=34613 RepID=A0A147BJS2_IXORI
MRRIESLPRSAVLSNLSHWFAFAAGACEPLRIPSWRCGLHGGDGMLAVARQARSTENVVVFFFSLFFSPTRGVSRFRAWDRT